MALTSTWLIAGAPVCAFALGTVVRAVRSPIERRIAVRFMVQPFSENALWSGVLVLRQTCTCQHCEGDRCHRTLAVGAASPRKIRNGLSHCSCAGVPQARRVVPAEW